MNPPQSKTKLDRRSRWILAAIIGASIALAGVLLLLGDRYAAMFFNTAYALLDPFVVTSSATATWQMIKRRSWFLAVLMGLMTLVMLGWTILDWGRLLG